MVIVVRVCRVVVGMGRVVGPRVGTLSIRVGERTRRTFIAAFSSVMELAVCPNILHTLNY